MNDIDPEKYLKDNKGLIESIVNRFNLDTSKFSRDDLVQEASLATVRALGKFDSTKSRSKLSTYVYSAVHRSCRDFVRKNKHDLKYTGYHQTQDWKAEKKVVIEVEDGPTPALTFGTKESPMAIRADAMNVRGCDGAESMMTSIPSGSPPPLKSMILEEQIDILKEEVNLLPEREREIISARFFDEKKLAEIAREQGVTRQRINQICKRGLSRLKTRVIDRLEYEILI